MGPRRAALVHAPWINASMPWTTGTWPVYQRVHAVHHRYMPHVPMRPCRAALVHTARTKASMTHTTGTRAAPSGTFRRPYAYICHDTRRRHRALARHQLGDLRRHPVDAGTARPIEAASPPAPGVHRRRIDQRHLRAG